MDSASEVDLLRPHVIARQVNLKSRDTPGTRIQYDQMTREVIVLWDRRIRIVPIDDVSVASKLGLERAENQPTSPTAIGRRDSYASGIQNVFIFRQDYVLAARRTLDKQLLAVLAASEDGSRQKLVVYEVCTPEGSVMPPPGDKKSSRIQLHVELVRTRGRSRCPLILDFFWSVATPDAAAVGSADAVPLLPQSSAQETHCLVVITSAGVDVYKVAVGAKRVNRSPSRTMALTIEGCSVMSPRGLLISWSSQKPDTIRCARITATATPSPPRGGHNLHAIAPVPAIELLKPLKVAVLPQEVMRDGERSVFEEFVAIFEDGAIALFIWSPANGFVPYAVVNVLEAPPWGLSIVDDMFAIHALSPLSNSSQLTWLVDVRILAKERILQRRVAKYSEGEGSVTEFTCHNLVPPLVCHFVPLPPTDSLPSGTPALNPLPHNSAGSLTVPTLEQSTSPVVSLGDDPDGTFGISRHEKLFSADSGEHLSPVESEPLGALPVEEEHFSASPGVEPQEEECKPPLAQVRRRAVTFVQDTSPVSAASFDEEQLFASSFYRLGCTIFFDDIVIDTLNSQVWKLQLDIEGISHAIPRLSTAVDFLISRNDVDMAKLIMLTRIRRAMRMRISLPEVGRAYRSIASVFSGARAERCPVHPPLPISPDNLSKAARPAATRSNIPVLAMLTHRIGGLDNLNFITSQSQFVVWPAELFRDVVLCAAANECDTQEYVSADAAHSQYEIGALIQLASAFASFTPPACRPFPGEFQRYFVDHITSLPRGPDLVLLHQFLQYHVIDDDRSIAYELLRFEQADATSRQLALDMLYRRKDYASIVHALVSSNRLVPAAELLVHAASSSGQHDSRSYSSIPSLAAVRIHELLQCATSSEVDFVTVYELLASHNASTGERTLDGADDAQKYVDVYNELMKSKPSARVRPGTRESSPTGSMSKSASPRSEK